MLGRTPLLRTGVPGWLQRYVVGAEVSSVRGNASDDGMGDAPHRGTMGTPSEAKDGIEQIREILVGAVQREVERKLARLESHLVTRLSELQQETRRRTDVIEAHLRKELEALSVRLE